MFRTTTIIVALLALTCAPLTVAAGGNDHAAWKAANEGTFRVTGFSFTRGVQDRLPADSVVAAPLDGERVYAHVTALNKGPVRELTLTWKRGGKAFHTVTLKVGRSPAWRTWAYLTAGKGKTGVWTVAVHDQDGTLLGEQMLILGHAVADNALARK